MYFCTRAKLMLYLQHKGFEVVGTMPNRYRSDMICWLFIRTPALMDAVDSYFRNLK